MLAKEDDRNIRVYLSARMNYAFLGHHVPALPQTLQRRSFIINAASSFKCSYYKYMFKYYNFSHNYSFLPFFFVYAFRLLLDIYPNFMAVAF